MQKNIPNRQAPLLQKNKFSAENEQDMNIIPLIYTVSRFFDKSRL